MQLLQTILCLPLYFFDSVYCRAAGFPVLQFWLRGGIMFNVGFVSSLFCFCYISNDSPKLTDNAARAMNIFHARGLTLLSCLTGLIAHLRKLLHSLFLLCFWLLILFLGLLRKKHLDLLLEMHFDFLDARIRICSPMYILLWRTMCM